MSTKSKISYDEFFIIESFLFTKSGGYSHLQGHIDRMCKSANYFGFDFNRAKIEESINNYATNLSHYDKYKVRFVLDERGKYTIENEPVEEDDSPKRILLSQHQTSANNIFYYHKTTKRTVYNAEFQKHCHDGKYFDVIFTNKNNELTEGTRTNLFVQKNGILYTPPIHCGLLKGIMRQHIIDTKNVREKILKLENLVTADKIFLTNSVRGMIEVIPAG